MQSIQFDMFAPAESPVIGQMNGLIESEGFDIEQISEPPRKRRSNAIKKAIKANQLLKQLEDCESRQDDDDGWLQCDMFATEWSDADILKLMDGLLVETLSVFNEDKTSMETVKDALDWVMSDDILPFSFIVCCRASGLDYEDVRNGVLYCLKRIARDEISQTMPADVF